ncbi:MAG: DNA polymerase III subunit [Oscillospiraceae bacterium]|nr:DNA polymerase III subunit [Oscillospiraceae bacterium]
MPGIKELKGTLSASLREGLLSHAVLIEGEKGTGRKELALWLAKAILCKSEERPCERCSVCRKIESGNHPDVEIYGGNGGARSFHIESIREIKNSLWLAPNESEQKVYILLNIENMTQEAQNALLKSLEEPPSHARFILTCDNRRNLLDTIVSRSTVYNLEPSPREECASALLENFPDLSEKDAELFSIACGGNFGAAKALIQEERGDIVFLAAKTPELLRGGNYYSLAAELNRKCAARADFSEYLEKLLNITGRCGIDRAAGKKTPVKVTPMEAVKTSEIIERGKLAVLQNCSVDLIESWLCMELSRVFGGNL